MSSEFKNGLPLKQASATAKKPAVERKAFSVERAPGGWVFVTVYYNDDNKIIEVKKSEPDIKPIILEKLKIAQFHHWTSIG